MAFGRDWWLDRQARRQTTRQPKTFGCKQACKPQGRPAAHMALWRLSALVSVRPSLISIAAGQSSDRQDARSQRSQLSNQATDTLPVVLSLGSHEETTNLVSSTILLRRLGLSIVIFRYTVTHAKTASSQPTPIGEVYCLLSYTSCANAIPTSTCTSIQLTLLLHQM